MNPSYSVVENISICKGENYKGFTETGTIVDSLLSVNGCDSIITTNLSVHPVYELTEDVSICEGGSYKGWSESGIYIDSLSSVSGCDSIITTSLTVNLIFESTEEISICEGDTYKGWTETGIYADTLISVHDCDSIIITKLTVNPSYSVVENISICKGEEYLGWTETGEYITKYVTIHGCDSVLTINLMVNPLPNNPDFFQRGDTLICNEGSEFKWYLNNTLINEGSSNQQIINSSGYYQIAISNELGCWSVRSDSVYVVKTNAIDFEENNLKIYPNPTSGKVMIEGLSLSETSTIKVFSSLGNLIYINEVSGFLHEIDLSGFASGMYHLQIIKNDRSYYFKVVKK